MTVSSQELPIFLFYHKKCKKVVYKLLAMEYNGLRWQGLPTCLVKIIEKRGTRA